MRVHGRVGHRVQIILGKLFAEGMYTVDMVDRFLRDYRAYATAKCHYKYQIQKNLVTCRTLPIRARSLRNLFQSPENQSFAVSICETLPPPFFSLNRG